MSTPTQWNEGFAGSQRSTGKSAIIWLHGAAYSFLQITQPRRIRLSNRWAPTIQYFILTWLRVQSGPKWAPQWNSRQIISLILWLLGKMIGNFAHLGTGACFNLPPTTITSLSSLGHNLAKLLDFATCPERWMSWISFAKLVRWTCFTITIPA